MDPVRVRMKSLLASFSAFAIPALVAVSTLAAEDASDAAIPAMVGAAFDGPAALALDAMRARAEALHVTGVAVVAYAEGAGMRSWSSRMVVVGSMTKPESSTDKGSNLLAIAYAKASEMASTLKDSGTGGRPLLTGELGWQGGVVGKGKTGILIAAFSGGRSEDDVSISKSGLGVLSKTL
jgi:hypothetical protein